MKMKRILTALLAGPLMWAFAAQAGTTTFKGVSVDYGSAVKTTSGDDVILTYNASGSLKLSGPVKARVLLVGGGGSGSSGGSSSNKSGYGGHGGLVHDESDVLLSGDYDIGVGAYGVSVKGSGSSRTQGAPGGNSTIINSFSKSIIRQAYGGGGGGDATPSGSGTTSNISGSNKAYGANGSNNTSGTTVAAAAANTGNGGQGGYGGNSSGKGGTGVVVIRLTAAVAGANLRDLVLPLDKTTEDFRDASDQPVSFVFSEVTCKSSADRVVMAVETADGKLGLQGLYPGRARVTIVKGDKTYLLDVAVVQLVTGLFRVGAYEVAVTNASEVKSVDGDLVITYLNTDAAVGKSFTLPQPTTGRLLAVGGGGAGGQDSDRSTSYGLPGGGGAGGMVTNDNQSFVAATYAVTVGAGGAAPRKVTRKVGENGTATMVKVNGGTLANALGGGGGGVRSVGNAGGSGGGGSYSSGSKNGGTKQQSSPGLGNKGGTGKHQQYGAGGGGAGGGGTACDTSSSSSGAGGAGVFCDITGESIEYARGGDGGVPRVNTTYESGGKEFWVEAEDGKPGLDGRGNGGGGSGHYSSSATYAGSGGSGIVVVRIPPYKTTVEDALKGAFGDQSVTVSDNAVTLNGDVAGPIRIPDNLGAVTINLNGYAIVGANGAEGDDITPGGDGQPALAVIPHIYDSKANAVTEVAVTGTGSLKGGNGGTGYPGGAGALAVAAGGYSVASGIAVTTGEAGESLVQHPHKWAYAVEDGKIIAYCVADDGVECSYRDHSRGPFVAISAADAAYTSMRYDELTSVNGITPVTGIVVAPETYVGRDGTDYPESSTPPREQGAYTVSMQLGDLRITSDFTITEPKPSQGSVYQAWKTAERKGRDVQIALSATFDGSKAINDGNVLFLGSRCSAHSMDAGTVESSVNALARYANVRWYAYGSKEPSNNNVNMMTRKGETVSGGTVTLVGGNHFVFKEMMDDLYAELVEKKNRTDGYDLLILEFDGDLLGRNGESPYQLVYSLPEGWTDEKAALLRAEMNRYYEEDRVVWIVPDVNKPKSDPGWTGEYPWTSNPEFVWQRAFLNATETKGYRCPLQKNYEDTDELVAYLQEVLVGHFFSNAIIKDTLANGLTIKKVMPQMRSDGGIWRNFEGGPSHYTIPEPRSDTTVKADVETTGRQVEVTFDMREEQAWACENNQVIGDDFRVVIDAELGDFFSVGEGEWQETNEGPATFTFTESNLDDDEEGFTITIEKDSPKIQNVKLTPDYASEDVVKTYDGKGTNIVVKPIAPTPDEAVIRYSLDEHGTYVDTLELTNVCEKTKVWFTITDKVGEFTTVTNFATVTILPRVVVEQAEDATKAYDGTPLMQPAHSNVLSRAIAEAEQIYPGRGASAAGFVTGEGFASVPMTADSQQTEAGSHANTIDRNAVTVNDKTDKNNYVFIYLPGVLTVTPPLSMGIAAFPVEKFYDAEPTNITWAVTNAQGVAITPDKVYLREQGTDNWIPAADFVQYVDTTNVTVEIKAEKSGFSPVTAEATVLVKPRPVTLVAGSAEKVFDGLPLTCDDFEEKDDETTPGYGFVDGEGVASVTMTGDSTITLPGSQPNVIATTVAEDGTKLDRNYIVTTEPGTLTVTPAAFTASAEPVEKFYDSVPTNIIVTVSGIPSGVTPTYEYSYSETEGFVPASDFTGPTNVSETATVYCRVIIPGTTNVVSAVATIRPRIVVSHAKDGEWTFNGEEHAQPDYFEDESEEAKLSKAKWGTDEALPDSTGFVEGEGYADDLVMTDASKITNPGTKPNVIDTAADKVALATNTKAENYELYYLDGTLTVTPATFTASAEPVEKFYDSTPTNIIVTVAGIPSGVTPTYEYSYSETEGFVPASDFTGPTNVSETATVYCRVIIPGTTNVVSAVATIRPRIVVSHAKDGEWTFNGEEHAQPDYYEDTDDEAERSKAKWGTDEVLPDSTGFVEGEGYAADLVMTDASKITNPGTKPNVIDTAADKTALKPNTKAENYELYYLDGTLTVTAATMGIQAFPAEKFYDAEPTNITYVVTNATGAVITDATVFLREKNTEPWIPVADFTPYVDTTNVTVEVKAEKSGFNPVEAEATVDIWPRPVTLVAASDSKVYDGLPLTNWTFTVKEDAAPEYGFVKDEGVEKVTMMPESTVTLPDTVPNVIATTVAKPNTKLERNYIVSTEPGTLTVTAATFTASATPYDEFYDGQEHTIEVEVQKPEDAGEAMITYAYAEDGTYLPIEDFEQLKDVTAGGPVTVYAKVEIEGYSAVVVSSTVNIKPRIVVEQAESAEKIFDGLPLVQPNHHEETAVETEKSKAKWGTDEVLANSTGFVAGEGFADVPMTASSTITEPGVEDNVIDAAAVTLLEGTKLGNYILFYLPGELAIIQRQEEVRRDPEIVIPEESKKVVEESDKKIEETLGELAKSDQEATGEPYVKYQLTVTPTNHLDEATRTTPEKAAEDAERQIELFKETVPDAKVDKVEFVDIVLERTYDKTEVEETAKGNYNKDNWEPIDKAEEHGNKLLEVTIPVDVPEGMELVGVTRSCDSRGTEILKPKDPSDPTAEGFIYDPETKTVTLYAKEFCVFGFIMDEIEEKDTPCKGVCSWVDLGGAEAEDAKIVYDFQASVKTTKGKKGKSTTQKVKLGVNSGGSVLWFNDPCLADGVYDGVSGVVTVDGKGNRKLNVKNLSEDQKQKLAVDLADYADIGTGKKSGGKWCAEFSYMTDAACYRVAGSQKIKSTYVLDGCGCCDDSAAGRFVDVGMPVSLRLPDLKTLMLHRFGGITLDKAKKVEIVAQIGDGPNPVFLRLAGQGDLATLKDSRGRKSLGIKSLSGTIVGVLPGPDCENCCDAGEPAMAFDCSGLPLDISDPAQNATAAFGSFTLKFNAKKSVFPAPVK